MAPPPPPFDTLGPEDWAAVWRAARRAQRAFVADGGARSASGATETVMLGEMSSSTHAEVGADVRGAWIELHNRRLREVHWPPMANPRGAHRSYRNNAATSRGLHTHNDHVTHTTENTTMATTRRKSRKPARRVKRTNPKARSSRRNPRVARKANGQFARKAATKRSNPSARYCASGARSLKKGLSRGGRASAKCRWDSARSNPGFAAGAPVWARINGRLYKATVLSTSGARARVAVIDPYSGRESIRETAVSHLQARPASRSNPRGDDREVTIYEVIYDGHGAGAAGDGTHIARFKSASDAARFAANHTAWGRPTKADAAKVPVRLARRWGVM